MISESVWDAVRQHPWKYTLRTAPIRLAFIHTTRGNSRDTFSEYEGGKNWAKSANNIVQVPGERAYASMWSRLVGGGGKLCIVVDDLYVPTFSAGHADPWAISWELCQPRYDTPIHPQDYITLVQDVARVCAQRDIPARAIPFLSGDNREKPGIAFHDASANGVKWGKSDPGPQLDKLRFANDVNDEMRGLPSSGAAGDTMIRLNAVAAFFENKWFQTGKYVMNVDTDFPSLPANARALRLEVFLAPTGSGKLVVSDASGNYAGQVSAAQRYGTVDVFPGPVPEHAGARGVRLEVLNGIQIERIGLLGYFT